MYNFATAPFGLKEGIKMVQEIITSSNPVLYVSLIQNGMFHKEAEIKRKGGYCQIILSPNGKRINFIEKKCGML